MHEHTSSLSDFSYTFNGSLDIKFLICYGSYQGPRSYFESGGLNRDSKCVCVWGGGGCWKHLFLSNFLKFPKK